MARTLNGASNLAATSLSAGLDLALFLDSSGAKSGTTYRTDSFLEYQIISPQVDVGPAADWRGGLVAWEPLTLVVQNDVEPAAGGSDDKTFTALNDLQNHKEVGSTGAFRDLWLDLTAGSFYSSVKLVTGASGTQIPLLGAAPGTTDTMYTGRVRNVSQADRGPLVVELESVDAFLLSRPFLRKLGYEVTGEENYDTQTGGFGARPFNEDARGDAVPLLYGTLDHAECVVPHLETSPDHTSYGHSLVLVVSDANHPAHVDRINPTIWIRGTSGAAVECARDDYNGTSHYEWIEDSTDPIRIGPSPTGDTKGAIVGGLDNYLNTTNSAGGSRDGNLLARRTVQATEGQVVGETLGDTGRVPLDDDDTTSISATCSSTGTTGFTNLFLWIPGEGEVQANFSTVQILAKFTRGTTGIMDAAGVLEIREDGGSGKSITPSTNVQGTSYNNWTGSDLETDMQVPADWSNNVARTREGLRLNIQERNAVTSELFTLFGGQADIWYQVPWKEQWSRLWVTSDGVKGALPTNYQRNSTDFLTNPADIFAHFVEQVIGGDTDTTAWQAASDDMDTDGLRLDFQITDYDTTGADVLDAIALQSQSMIFANAAGQLVIKYRPTSRGASADGQAPFSDANIIAGSFRWELTEREDMARGVVVNYGWSALERRYRSQAVIAPTAGEFTTNVTSGADYTAAADDIADTDTQILEVDADYIQDETTAERLAKWLFLAHSKRRQVIEFDAFPDALKYEPGDVIYIDRPEVRTLASGDQLESRGTAAGDGLWQSNATTYAPAGDTGQKGAGAVHVDDLLIIESGTYAGSWVCGPTSGSSNLYALGASGFPSSGTTISSAWRVLPSFEVLACRLVYDSETGPRARLRVVERPTFLPGSLDL